MTKQQILDQKQYQKLQSEIATLLQNAKKKMQDTTTGILAQCYWEIGMKIEQEGLRENANYKNLLLENLEEDLRIDKSTLFKALKFYNSYPKGVQDGINWSQYRRLITINDPKTRNQLTQKTKEQNLSVRELEVSIKELNEPNSTTKKSTTKIKRPTDPSYLYKAKIIDVVDGDTLILHIDLGFEVIKKQRVRLTQINAPEIKTAAGKKSHQYLRDLCASIEEVAIKTNKVDIYGRYLVDVFYLKTAAKKGTTQGDIFSHGVYLNEKIVEDGMAKII